MAVLLDALNQGNVECRMRLPDRSIVCNFIRLDFPVSSEKAVNRPLPARRARSGIRRRNKLLALPNTELILFFCAQSSARALKIGRAGDLFGRP
jgi:hypothetical protein